MPNGGGLIHIITDRLALHRAGDQSLFYQPFSLLLLLLLDELSWGDTEMLAENGREIGKRGEAYGIGHLSDIHLLLLQ